MRLTCVLTDRFGYDVRTKWKRQTTAPMRAEQLRNHSCDERDCPGARRLHQTSGVPPPSTPSSPEVVSSYCRHCDTMQRLGKGPSVTPSSDDSLGHGDIQRQTTTTSLTGQLLSRLYLSSLQLPFTNYCRI